jgi:acetyl esterase/lipase
MISLNQEYLARQGASAGLIRGFFGLAGPYEGGFCAGVRCPTVFPDSERDRWRVADFVDKTDPPMLLVIGQFDKFVTVKHHEGLAAAARSLGVNVDVLELPNEGHTSLWYSLHKDNSAVRLAVFDFIAGARSPH